MIQTERNTSEMHCYRIRCQTYRSEVKQSRGQQVKMSRVKLVTLCKFRENLHAMLWRVRSTFCHLLSALTSLRLSTQYLLPYNTDTGHVSLLSRCHILASAEHGGCIWQHQWQLMPRSHWQNSAAARGDAAVCWLVNSRWQLCLKNCNFVPFNIYCIMQLNENDTNFCFTLTVCFASLHVINQQQKLSSSWQGRPWPQ